MESRHIGARQPTREVRVAFAGERRALAARTVRRIVEHVLDTEGAGDTRIAVTFLSSARMRGLNRRTFRDDRSTDVIAFGMAHDGTMLGDVYVCPGFARRSSQDYGIGIREELIRLVIHGTLHVLGWDHPRGTARLHSPMWTAQEGYVRQALAAAH